MRRLSAVTTYTVGTPRNQSHLQCQFVAPFIGPKCSFCQADTRNRQANHRVVFGVASDKYTTLEAKLSAYVLQGRILFILGPCWAFSKQDFGQSNS